MTQKSTIVIALALASVAGLAFARTQFANDAADNQFLVLNTADGMERRSNSFKFNANGAKRLRVEVQLGEVEVETTSGSEFRADITREINKPLDNEERRWLEGDWIRAKREGDTLVVYEVPGEKPKLMSGNHKDSRNLNMKVKIQVPKGLDADIDIDAGTVKFEGSYHSVKSHIDAGEISTRNFASDQFVKLDLAAGQIDAKLAKTPSSDSSLKVNVGEISLDLKGSASVEASVGIGDIDVPGESGEKKGLGSRQQIRIGSGGTKFRLEVDAGSINLAQGKTEKRFDVNETPEVDVDIDMQGNLGEDFSKGIESAMRGAEKAMKAALSGLKDDKDLQEEIDSAMREAQKELKEAFKENGDVQKEIEAAMREAHQDVEKALKEAQKEIDKAMKEVEQDKDAAKSAHAIARDAMKAAQRAMALAREEMKKALKNRKDNESI